MNYRQALDYVLSFADFERSSSPRVRYRDFNLERVADLLERLGNPQRSFASVHIAGTKGKGSTSAMTAAILQAAGFRTGLYTSPHLHTMRERIAIDGLPISEAQFAAAADAIAPAVAEVNAHDRFGQLTTFELLTAMAFVAFRDLGVTHAILEVGLGGRLDATNVVQPEAVAITNISLDHTEVLGSTLGHIAGEKAAIIKRGIPVVSGPQQPEALTVIERVAHKHEAPLTLVGRDVTWEEGERVKGQGLRVKGRGLGEEGGQRVVVRTAQRTYDIWCPLLGAYQRENIATAIALAERLVERGVRIEPQHVIEGLAKVSWPCRLEIIAESPLIVVDGAHNPYSISRLREAVAEVFPRKRVIMILGVTKTKDLGGMLDEAKGIAGVLLATRSRHPKAVPPEIVAVEAASRGIRHEAAGSPAEALARARALSGPDDVILATGSLFVAAEVREIVKGIAPEVYTTGAVTV